VFCILERRVCFVDKEGDSVQGVIVQREGKEEGSATSRQSVFVVGCAASFTTLDQEIDRFSWCSGCLAIVGRWQLSTHQSVQTVLGGELPSLHRALAPWGNETVPDIKIVISIDKWHTD